ncbi:MAG: riboflavin biosynthesis protein RibF, partial [Lachnospiraceae bacterium]|nr:riboflavin biosynthesis protein RibF [Lachnospiraceae bacterium]
MIILNDFFQNRIEEPTAFTIGKFDGLHRGHELLFEDVLAQKECLPCILTFKISPRVAILKEEDR